MGKSELIYENTPDIQKTWHSKSVALGTYAHTQTHTHTRKYMCVCMRVIKISLLLCTD